MGFFCFFFFFLLQTLIAHSTLNSWAPGKVNWTGMSSVKDKFSGLEQEGFSTGVICVNVNIHFEAL